MDSAQTPPSPKSRPRGLLKSIAPWLVSAGLLSYVLATQDLEKVYKAFAEAAILPFLAWVAVFVVFWLFLEAYFLHLCTGWFLGAAVPNRKESAREQVLPWRYWDMVRARAASYLLTMLNFIVGYGGLVVYLKRRFNIPYRRSSAVMMNELLHEFASFGVLALFAVSLLSESAPEAAAQDQTELAGAVGASALGFYLLCFFASRLSRLVPDRLQQENLFTPFAWSPARSWLALLGIKVAQNGAYGLFVILAMPAFGLHPPAGAGIALTQLVRLARGIPISAFGIGVDQLSFPYLFQGWALGQENSLVAFSMAFTFSLIAARFLVGLPFLAGISRELFIKEEVSGG